MLGNRRFNPLGRPSISALEAPLGPRPGDHPPEPLFLVEIDLDKLRENLTATWRRNLTPSEVREYLSNAGFRAATKGWLAPERVLMRLEPTEIVSSEPIRDRRAAPGRN